jgi:hypothetical protein
MKPFIVLFPEGIAVLDLMRHRNYYLAESY